MKKFQTFFLLLIILPLSGCMTMNDYNYSRIDANLSVGDYQNVQEELKKNSSKIYTSHDKLLMNLDEGLLEHFSGNYSESNQRLSRAEQLFQEYSALSIGQSISSFVMNDTYGDYSGEDYENIYSNIFMALNYVALELDDDAMVEVRRFDNKIKVFKQNYEKTVLDSQKSASDNSGVSVKKVSIKFSDSALARYISMLLYRNDGDYDNAALDCRFIRKAFESQKSLYNFDVPKTIEEEESITRNDCRLNVIAFHGKAPVKREEAVRAYSATGEIWYKIALPKMEKRKSDITQIKVKAVSAKTGKTYEKNLEKIESIENIAVDTFQQHYSVMFAKSLIRSITHALANRALREASRVADKRGNEGVALVFGLMDMASKIHTEAVERADVRCSRYFPANASVTGLNLEPGEYHVTVSFMKGNSVVHQQKQTLNIKKGTLNLVESACLR